ncbi:type VI secretion system baseplate subunit TssG [Enterobacter hormaechei]|uniref:type VI secretion system baseplate subunit TssG n=1 Tax=Enterobacter cloacae complex TaxID=354276 RepID=UPI00092F8487|nr:MULTISPECIES: type VI secretion system baseplate subunit TssG [Enterobacter cloacae complex]UTA17274.1 type VI secretion system baseplate subunit TssG [Enterobacter cloacae]EHJ4150588.1 type VI secretion system baseplate subunit TssG [Enterobacter hormaechei]EKS6534646.1 type VI secretion system baseplate subunit TssG [Enterobacter hormaechei]EKS6536867.1 type VI secretion system baseplate subunit TssG [Enterobacter hormaechei]EKS6547450.1 type VI secretion system baseplate subunit TssG [En
MYPVERESQSAPARLMAQVRHQLPYMNFYRFCQLLEQSLPEMPVPGSDWRVRQEPVRFRPHPGMGFPSGEIRGMEDPEHPHLPPSVRVTFMGLYGVESPLPTHYTDDIAQRREGHDATQDFLDIFSHRLITQYYRIWRKYSYPATFKAGGADNTSQYLLGLAGLGIPGCAQAAGTPLSRFLALLPVMMLPGRTAEGMGALVRLLAPDTRTHVYHHDRCRIPLKQPVAMSTCQPVSLKHRPVMGTHATDVNGQVLLRLSTDNPEEIRGWLPGGDLHADLMALLHVWLGAHLDVRMQLCVARHLLPDARLSCNAEQIAQVGRTAVLRPLNPQQNRNDIITIHPGRFQRVRENIQRRKNDEDGDYRW